MRAGPHASRSGASPTRSATSSRSRRRRSRARWSARRTRRRSRWSATAASAWAGRSVPARFPPGLTLAPDGTPGGHDDLGHADDGRHVDVHRQGGRHRRLPARPLDDEAVHARRRRAARGRAGRASSPPASSARPYQSDARDGYRRPRPLHVEPCRAARCRPGSRSTPRRAPRRESRRPQARSRSRSRATDADGRVGTADAAITVVQRARPRHDSPPAGDGRRRVQSDAARARRSSAADVSRHRREAPGQAEAQREVRRHQRQAPDSGHVPLHGHGHGTHSASARPSGCR